MSAAVAGPTSTTTFRPKRSYTTLRDVTLFEAAGARRFVSPADHWATGRGGDRLVALDMPSRGA
jgi:hypothetical protein